MSNAVPLDAAPGETVLMTIRHGLDAVVSSPLGRSIETAQFVSASL